MASDITDQDSVLSESILKHLTFRARGSTSSSEIERAITDALNVFRRAAAQFAREFNDTRPPCAWDTIPAELQLEIVHQLPVSHRAKLLGVSHGMRALLLSDPSLWTSITTPSLSDDARAEYLRTMLARSGNCPLDIVWTDAWEFRDELAAPPRDAIPQAISRTKTLALHLSYFAPGPRRFWAYSAPLLEKLTFSFLNYHIHYSCIIVSGIWSGHVVPALRELKLPTIIIDGPPRSPFESVRSLQINIAAITTGIQWLWEWFPRVQKLHVYVCSNDAPPIPAPPASLRHLILFPAMNCTNPLRVLGGWGPHNVLHVELYEPYGALEAGLEYLDRTVLLSAAFTPACRPEEHWRNATVVRVGDMTLAIWSNSSYDQRLQIYTPGLIDRLERVTLGEGVLFTTFRQGIAFPVLRSLTVTGSNDFGAVLYEPLLRLRTPVLEELIIDLVSDNSVDVALGLLSELVSRIQHTNRLREIVIYLSHDSDRHSLAITSAMANLEPIASQVRVERHPAAQCRQDPCICSESRTEVL